MNVANQIMYLQENSRFTIKKMIIGSESISSPNIMLAEGLVQPSTYMKIIIGDGKKVKGTVYRLILHLNREGYIDARDQLKSLLVLSSSDLVLSVSDHYDLNEVSYKLSELDAFGLYDIISRHSEYTSETGIDDTCASIELSSDKAGGLSVFSDIINPLFSFANILDDIYCEFRTAIAARVLAYVASVNSSSIDYPSISPRLLAISGIGIGTIRESAKSLSVPKQPLDGWQ